MHPGHIWYDMEFDVEPHTDRHNRVGPGGQCPPRHPTRSDPSYLELDGTL